MYRNNKIDYRIKISKCLYQCILQCKSVENRYHIILKFNVRATVSFI